MLHIRETDDGLIGMFHIRESDGLTVCYDRRNILSREEMERFLRATLSRKQYRGGKFQELLARLDDRGRINHAWNFNYRRAYDNLFFSHRMKVRVWRLKSGYLVVLQGNVKNVSWALERANNAVRKPEKIKLKKFCWKRKKKDPKRRPPKRWSERRQETAPEQKRKRERAFVAAPISEERMECLRPQFRNHFIFWQEAISLAVNVFDIRDADSRRSWKRSPEELAAMFLFESLEQNGGRFAQIKRRGFCLRFDLTDGRFRGDITPLTVSCTKDSSPAYRRMRDYLKETLTGLKLEEQRRRKEIAALQLSFQLVA